MRPEARNIVFTNVCLHIFTTRRRWIGTLTRINDTQLENNEPDRQSKVWWDMMPTSNNIDPGGVPSGGCHGHSNRWLWHSLYPAPQPRALNFTFFYFIFFTYFSIKFFFVFFFLFGGHLENRLLVFHLKTIIQLTYFLQLYWTISLLSHLHQPLIVFQCVPYARADVTRSTQPQTHREKL